MINVSTVDFYADSLSESSMDLEPLPTNVVFVRGACESVEMIVLILKAAVVSGASAISANENLELIIILNKITQD